ncbi:23610_t:CDS:2, partial [Cetraspora pellucida]
PIMLKVNNMLESLEAFEYVVKSATKSSRFAFHNNWNIIEKSQKRKKNTQHDYCLIYIRTTVTECNSTTNVPNSKIIWIITNIVLNHNHILFGSDEIVTFLQYHAMSLNQKSLVY